MASARNKLLSQLSLYRKHNLRYLDSRFEEHVHFKPMDDLSNLPLYLNSIFPVYLTSIPHLISGYLQVSRANNTPKYEFRSTRLEDMDATNYDVEAKLSKLSKSRSTPKKTLNRESRAHFSTKSLRKMKETKLPTDRIARAASLAGMILNVATAGTKDALGRYIRGEYKDVIKSSLTSDEVIKHVVECLCKMRGTALKFGQMLSMQSDILPENFRRALISSRHEADIMTKDQVEESMIREFGEKWMDNFQEFNFDPMASASLGQAHRAKLKDGTDVAVKIQFPGVLDSIDSDIENLIWICTYSKLVPESFFIRQYTQEMKTEVIAECNYLNEAKFYEIYRKLDLEGFLVPKVIHDLTTKTVITTEFVKGKPVEDLKDLSQEVKDSVGRRILKLSLSEIFAFELMNTDPNPSNYLYDEESDLIGLIDFGSSRIFDRKFVKQYYDLVMASLKEDYDLIIEQSIKIGFLHPEEEQVVVKAHIDSVNAVSSPFKKYGIMEFKDSDIFTTVMDRSKVIFTKRKLPPPPEIYSLHRKLAGAFLICKIIGSRFDSKKVFDEVMEFSDLDEVNTE